LLLCKHPPLFRQQGKRLASLEMELAAAKHKGFVGKYTPETNGTHSGKKPLIVIGIMSSFGRKNYRDAVRKSWLPTGTLHACIFLASIFFVF
jgi:hydroxyproline O-galactosyltransferase HPGT